ncbi:MAG: trigger factor [Candidatus Kerfeldbacteria bacterium]|nr:trigger factor [Candidatus Kerfeldbacteria bacterium]
MKIEVAPQPKSTVKLTVELSPDEMKPHLERAAEVLSKGHQIEGFRPGKASLGIVLQRLGAQAVWEEAAEQAVRKSYAQAVKQHGLQTVGPPKISVHKLAPDNPFVYHAEIAVLPEIVVGNYRELKVKRAAVEVKPEQVDRAVADLQSMFAKEVLVDRPAQRGDKIEIDFDLAVGHVPVEGGSSKQHPVVIGSGHFIPGFEDQLIGLRKEERKEFTLTFPSDYKNRQVAGQQGTFKVMAKAVYQIDQPQLNDDFAKRASKQQTLNDLRQQLERNLRDEAAQKNERIFERAIVDELITKSKFSELPEVLVDHEVTKMLNELQEEVERRGGAKFDDYLQGLKKTTASLKLEFRPQAEHRVKSALLLRQIAKRENITATTEEVEQEVKQALQMYTRYPELRSQIESDDYRDFARVMLTNRQVVARLKKLALGQT